ncbi:23071_t:CDS:2, partial [Racocetra persica]
ECLIFTFERLWEEENLFKILFVEPITFQGQEIHYLAIPKDNLRPIRSYLTEEKEDQATITDEEKNNNSPEDSSQQPKTSIKQSELERVAFTVERIRGYSDSSNAFRIHFTEEIEYQTTKVKGLAISKTQSGENLSKKLQILEAGEKFEIIIAGAGLAVNQGPGFSYLEATLDNIREIRKLGTEASSPASNAETSQKQVVTQLSSPSKFKILELTQFMFAKETLDSNDPAARFSFPVLLSELTGFNDTLRGNPNHGYIKPLVKDLLQQLHQNNKITKRIMERYEGSLEETPDGEVSSNRYATVESEEEEISDWSDDESLQKHQALIAEQKEVGKLLDSVEKDRAEGKLSQTQIQEK